MSSDNLAKEIRNSDKKPMDQKKMSMIITYYDNGASGDYDKNVVNT